MGQQYVGAVLCFHRLPCCLVCGGGILEVQPRYMLLGGAIGAGITWTVIKSMDQLGPAKAALLIVIAQLIVAYVIELLGLFGVDKTPFDWKRAGGLLIALIGIAIFQWK